MHESTPQPLTCPVCQAKQVAANQCRRCRADLSAVNVARHSVALASVATIMQAITGHSQGAAQSLKSLDVLHPHQAQSLRRCVELAAMVRTRGKQRGQGK